MQSPSRCAALTAFGLPTTRTIAMAVNDERMTYTQPWDEKDATAVEEEFSLEDLFGDDDDAPAKDEL